MNQDREEFWAMIRKVQAERDHLKYVIEVHNRSFPVGTPGHVYLDQQRLQPLPVDLP